VALVAVLGCVLLHAVSQRLDAQAARPRSDGIPDTGLLAMEANRKLDEVNRNLAALNQKMDRLIGLLEGGQVKVLVVEPQARAVQPADSGR
jgi:hypothetical protein